MKPTLTAKTRATHSGSDRGAVVVIGGPSGHVQVEQQDVLRSVARVEVDRSGHPRVLRYRACVAGMRTLRPFHHASAGCEK